MDEIGEKECPICDGSGIMSVVEFRGIYKMRVRVPCTACEGSGRVPFVVHTEVIKRVEVKTVVELRVIGDIGEIEDGWRKMEEWTKVHYFVDGRSLCGNVRSQRFILRSVKAVDVGPEEKCSICMRLVEHRTAGSSYRGIRGLGAT